MLSTKEFLNKVSVFRNNGFFSIFRERLPLDNELTVIQKSPETIKTFVQMPNQSRLQAALMVNAGELPSGITPLIITDNIENVSNSKLVWICLGYLVPTKNLDFEQMQVSESVPSAESVKSLSNENADKMTYNQRRYLFRLLSQRQIKGEEAIKHLQGKFKVDDVNDILKTDASQYIDELVNHTGGSG